MSQDPTTDVVSPAEPSTPATRSWAVPLVSLAFASLLVGAVAGWAWSRLVTLPAYLVRADGSAAVTERALTEFFVTDAVYVLCGAVAGVLLGLGAWLRFRRLGWPVALVAVGAGTLAGVVCWQLGQVFGPGPLGERLASATAGDVVPIPLELGSISALAVWAFAALAPVLLGSALGRDEEAPRPTRRRRRRPSPVTEHVDDRGVLTAVEPPEAAS